MSGLPARDDPGSNFNRWEVWEAYKRGDLKSRDELNEEAALFANHPTATITEILDTAWGEDADE